MNYPSFFVRESGYTFFVALMKISVLILSQSFWQRKWGKEPIFLQKRVYFLHRHVQWVYHNKISPISNFKVHSFGKENTLFSPYTFLIILISLRPLNLESKGQTNMISLF
jgi:hypothetical protein